MDAARVDELILEGKNSQEIRKKLKERTQKSFEIKNKGKKVPARFSARKLKSS